MKATFVRYFIIAWFGMLLLLVNTPVDFIHQFADHQDTVHKPHKGLVIEKKHHHCAFLSIPLTSFINDYHVPVLANTKTSFFSKHKSVSTTLVQRNIISAALRGPPIA